MKKRRWIQQWGKREECH